MITPAPSVSGSNTRRCLLIVLAYCSSAVAVCRYVALAQRREVRRQQLEQQYNATPRAAPQLPGRAGAPAAPVPMPGVFPPNAVQFQPQFYGPPANAYGPGPQGPRGGPQVGYGGPMYPQVSPLTLQIAYRSFALLLCMLHQGVWRG